MNRDDRSGIARALQRRLVKEAREESPPPGAHLRSKQALALIAVTTSATAAAGAQAALGHSAGSSILATVAASTTAKVGVALVIGMGIGAGYTHQREGARDSERITTQAAEPIAVSTPTSGASEASLSATLEPAETARAPAKAPTPSHASTPPRHAIQAPISEADAPALPAIENPPPAAPSVPTPTPSPLRIELSALEHAQAQMRTGHLADARKALEGYFQTHPNGRLAAEAQMLEIDILRAQKQDVEARRKAEIYVQQYPNSPGAMRILRERITE